MRRSFKHFALLLFGIFFVFFPLACAGGLETAGNGPDLQWYKTFGGGKDDWGYSVKRTKDDGYIMSGSTSSYGAGNDDLWLIKTDARGNKLWGKTFGGEKNEAGLSVQQTTDSGYIVCEATKSYGAGGADAWLVKTDASGNKLWDKTFGGVETDVTHSVQQTRDGGYILCGSTMSRTSGNNEMWVIKTDADGNRLWDKTFNGKGWAIGSSIQQTEDGGYIACGSTSITYPAKRSDYEVLVIKTDAAGDREWDTIIANDAQEQYIGKSVQQTIDGDYVVYAEGRMEVFLIMVDSKGTKLWYKKYGEQPNIIDDAGNSVQQTTDDGYIVCGTGIFFIEPRRAQPAVWLMKVDENGNGGWIRTFTGNMNAGGSSVQQTIDGGYIVCGSTKSSSKGYDILLMKIAPDK
jgi:hypothetical protein